MHDNDSTAVTGTPVGAGLRTGQVIAERYEVRSPHRDDVYTFDYRAFDQETESDVLLRQIQPDVLMEPGARERILNELTPLIGTGGAYLPGLLSVEREEGRVFVIEPWPTGACLREVLDQRIDEGRPLTAAELLPVIASLEGALQALPPGQCHGDIRTEQVWIDTSRLQLTGPFVVAQLSPATVSRVLRANAAVRRRAAPEQIREGATTRATDRYGVASIAWEALTGVPAALASTHPVDPGELAPELRAAVEAFLHDNAESRPSELRPIVEALARAAGLPAPMLDPIPRSAPPARARHDTVPMESPLFADQVVEEDDDGEELVDTLPTDARAPVSLEEAERVVSGIGAGRPPLQDVVETRRVLVDTEEDLAPDAKITAPHRPAAITDRLGKVAPEGDAEGTQQISADQFIEEGTIEEDHEPERETETLDPRFVRAALGVKEAPPTPLPRRQRRDTEREDPNDIFGAQVAPDDDDEVTGVHGDRPGPAPVAAAPPPLGKASREGSGTLELGADDLEMVEQAIAAPAPQKAPDPREIPKAPRTPSLGGGKLGGGSTPPAGARQRRQVLAPTQEPFQVPDGVKPIPRPRRPSFFQKNASPRGADVLFDDSQTTPRDAIRASSLAGPPKAPPRDLAPTPPISAERPLIPTDPAPRMRSATATRRGMVIVIASLVLAALIIGISMMWAAHRRAVHDREWNERLNERFEQIQRQAHEAIDPGAPGSAPEGPSPAATTKAP